MLKKKNLPSFSSYKQHNLPIEFVPVVGVVGSYALSCKNSAGAVVRCFKEKISHFCNNLLQRCVYKSRALPLTFLSEC